MQFLVVDDINEATHWVAEFDNRIERDFLRNRITPGKEYKLVKGEMGWTDWEPEIFIKDDCGDYKTHYILWHGHYIKYI